jgi:hypothetical protein
MLPLSAAQAPLRFVRLVYSILTATPVQRNNQTPFWNRLAECAGINPPNDHSLACGCATRLFTRVRTHGFRGVKRAVTTGETSNVFRAYTERS